ncbi:hypothetical protein niasHS_000248 [Heterodera schachtii]|uniref:Peptidase S1 domain-containing protein n=1 Tax=Heterodera schachtii TaxID=97005 RepID=A0ABD2KHU8_HETSC
MRIISKQKCSELSIEYEKVFTPYDGNLEVESIINAFDAYSIKSNICVVPEQSIGEPGDSGGPLMSKVGKNNWVQLGVLTVGDCRPKNPTSTEGLFAQYAPIDCEWLAEATDGEVKCQTW